ncbi:HupE/UreJ protein [Aquimarina sp. MAR_2010_214]|uniref:HupE/UreJ family protein n=1 Tax=Aquimarina sp. MAR_2010_214 TaxID=1250026 RepID=UPI000C70CD71|nr:HupE/UreJ family protein [Aquimarina sp. MAR_2010_214]PKV49282.1 HupE/UreJ protein [Aquimarina sp. MAR_2010_214]
MSEFWLYLKLGFGHVLDWHAYDHILFLIVLTVGYTFDSWKRILVLVTLFTIGHTFSLFLAAYNVVSVNSRLVEFLIPLSILMTGLFNVFTAKNTSKNSKIGILYGVTIFFGLIHGLGFSSYFKAISSNVSSKILPLIEFALGVEAAQIIIVLLVLIVSFVFQTFFRFSKRDWILVVSSIVIGMVIPMLIANKIW